MGKLIAVDGQTFQCSVCGQVFAAPPVRRGMRAWSEEEARAKLGPAFREHVEKVHGNAGSGSASVRRRAEE